MQQIAAAAGVTGLYAAIFAILLVAISAYVIRNRVKLRVPLGDGGKSRMLNAIRIQGNFCEYVPLALLLVLLLELNGAGASLLHGLCLVLLAGRLLHAFSLAKEVLILRQIGMVLTFGVLVVSAVLLLVRVL